jgi:hypothetical protein
LSHSINITDGLLLLLLPVYIYPKGTSFTFLIPAIPAALSRSGVDELQYNIEVTVPATTSGTTSGRGGLPAAVKALKKSDRPHLFVTAFCLNTKRELRKSKQIHALSSSSSSSLSVMPIDSPSFSSQSGFPSSFATSSTYNDYDVDADDEHDSKEMVWSQTKLRNTTEGGFKFSVPLDKEVSYILAVSVCLL